MAAIFMSVGKNGANRPSDVRIVQTLLNQQIIPGDAGKLSADGRVGPETISKIQSYQNKILKFSRPDGRIDPDGITFRSLKNRNGIALSLHEQSQSFSAKGVTYLKSLEGLSLKPYDDQSGKEINNWVAGATIGYGHLIKQTEWSKYKDGLIEVQAENLFLNDIAPFVAVVRASVTRPINQQQFDALTILAFNIGATAFSNSSVVKLVNDPTAVVGYLNLKSAWMAWTTSQGREMQGLITRRSVEWNIYERGVYP